MQFCKTFSQKYKKNVENSRIANKYCDGEFSFKKRERKEKTVVKSMIVKLVGENEKRVWYEREDGKRDEGWMGGRRRGREDAVMLGGFHDKTDCLH